MTVYERPGRAFYATATKAVDHGWPCVELKVVGTAVKTKARSWKDGFSDTRLAGTQTIAIAEKFTIRTKGIAEVRQVVTGTGAYDISAGTLGAAVYITEADNSLSLSAGAGKVPFGRIVELPAGNRGVAAGRTRVDMDQKDSI